MFRKSSHCESAGCAEVGFRKASYSSVNGQCAEAGATGTEILVRDTKQADLGEDRTVLRFSPAAWELFTGQIRQGRLPLAIR